MSRHLSILCSALACVTSFRHRHKGAARQRYGEWTAVSVDANAPEALQADLDFRGNFRDFALYKDTKISVESKEEMPPPRAWVVEFDNLTLMESESARASSLGLQVVFQRGGSLVIEGDVPSTLGYDACGGNTQKTVVPVSDHEVTLGTMPESDLSKYLELAKTRNGRNIALRDRLSKESIQGFIQKLQDYGSRNSYTGEGGTLDQAADWAAEKLQTFGWSVTRDDFQPGNGWFQRRITPQVVAELPGTEHPERVVVVGAHLDSINQGWGSDEAPGADDNGSGSSVLLELARIIGLEGAKFKNTLRLVLFTGEEQGLLGSASIARRWKQEGVDIVCMLNADMMGYKLKDEPVTFALVSRNSDAGLLNIVRTATETYMAAQLTIGTSTVCCSDQQSFTSNGFPALAIFETPTSRVVYPEYHRATDLLVALDMDQMEQLGSGFMASVILFAELVE